MSSIYIYIYDVYIHYIHPRVWQYIHTLHGHPWQNPLLTIHGKARSIAAERKSNHRQVAAKHRKDLWPPGNGEGNGAREHSNTGWRLTYPSEKKESQLGWFFPIYGKIKAMFQTTTQNTYVILLYSCTVYIALYINLMIECIYLTISNTIWIQCMTCICLAARNSADDITTRLPSAPANDLASAGHFSVIVA